MATDWSDTIAVSQLADEPALSDELTGLIQRIGAADSPPHVVLDLRAVTYLNSSNIAQLLHLRATVRDRGRNLRLCCLSDEVWSVLLIAGLDRVFQFAPDTITAIAGLQLEESDGG